MGGRTTAGRVLTAAAVLAPVVLTAGCDSKDPVTVIDTAAVWAAVRTDLSASMRPGDLRSIVVSQRGRTLLAVYPGGGTADEHWDVETVTQSVVSTLVGIAIGEGRISGISATLAELLPSYRADMAPGVESVTLAELLTMSAGLPPDGQEAWTGDLGAPDPVAAMLRHVDPGQRGNFAYSKEDAALLVAIVQRAVGAPLLDYARSRLFGPLGIDTRPAYQPVVDPTRPLPSRTAIEDFERAGFAWPTDRTGVPLGSSLLKLTPADMTKVGELYAAGGVWQGRRILPAIWVRESTRAQIATVGSGVVSSRYGYLWWVDSADGHACFLAGGYGGQLIEVVPDLGLVVTASTELDYTGASGPDGISATTLSYAVAHEVVPAVTAAIDRAG